MSMRLVVAGGIGASVLCGASVSWTHADVASPPAAPTAAADPSPADAERVCNASVKSLVQHEAQGYDLTYVARTTIGRDLPAWRVAAGKNKPAGQLMLGLCNYYGLGGARNAERGLTLIRAAADAGHAEAMAILSIVIRNGDLDTRPDADAANEWLGKAVAAKSAIAADLLPVAAARESLIKDRVQAAVDTLSAASRAGNLNASVEGAALMRRSWLWPSDIDSSIALLKSTASRGHIVAMVELGQIYAGGRLVPPDPAQAKRWLDAAAATLDPRALAAAANAYDTGRLDASGRADLTRGAALWAQLAANGDPYSSLALYFRPARQLSGRLIAADVLARDVDREREQRRLLFDAASRGVSDAFVFVAGAYHLELLGLKKDATKVQRLLEDGVEAGDPEALFNLACGQRAGFCGAADEDKARTNFFAAARLGVPGAMTSVGLRYISGRGVPLDLKRGHLCYLTAAFAGDVQAMEAVADQFAGGYGTERDLARARRWCALALAEGSRDIYETIAAIEGANDADFHRAMLPAKALAAYEDGVRAGSMRCEQNLGERLVRGTGVKPDVKRGIALLEHAAAHDDNGRSHSILGGIYHDGTFVPQDYARGLLYYRSAAARGDGEAWAWIGHMTLHGQGTAADPQEAVRCLEKGVTLGSATACGKLAELLADGEIVTKDTTRAISLWRRGADGGDGYCCHVLASACLEGRYGEPVNQLEGLKWCERALAQGVPAAAVTASHFFRAKEDWTAERGWLERADAMGDPDAPNELGVQYRFGRGVTQDFAKAAACYRRGADRGCAIALSNLACLTEAGMGVDKDVGEAFRMQLKAAKLGEPIAMLNTSRMYLDGIGIARDQAAGLDWLQRAADAGNPTAKAMVTAAKAKGVMK